MKYLRQYHSRSKTIVINTWEKIKYTQTKNKKQNKQKNKIKSETYDIKTL